MLIFKVIFLFLAVFFTIVNTARAVYKNDVPFINFFTQAVGITGFVTLQWLV